MLVLGAGVAGLQAHRDASRRLGAVRARPATTCAPPAADDVRSVGAVWLEVAGIEATGEGGYARELSDDERTAQQAALAAAIGTFDAVITTAAIPGRRAPTLVTAAAVARMRAGSVVVDLAADSGGNCELSRPGETCVEHDVTIVAPLLVAASLPEHASQLYARNVQALVELMLDTTATPPALHIDLSDDILAASCIAKGAADPRPAVPEAAR